jgi:hypothetical protein
MHVQQAVLSCWRQQLTLSQEQRLSVVAALRSSSIKAQSSSRQALREWRRVTAQHWTFRRSLLHTLQPLLAKQLSITLLQACWQGWVDATTYSRRISRQKCAVGAWVSGCAERQAAQAAETMLSVVLSSWHGYTRQQASRRKLQRAMVARAQRSSIRKAIQAWQGYQAEEVEARRLECISMCQVLHLLSKRLLLPCAAEHGIDTTVTE